MKPDPRALRAVTFVLAAVGLALLVAGYRTAEPRPWLRGAALVLGASQLVAGWRMEALGQRRFAWMHVLAGALLVLLGLRS